MADGTVRIIVTDVVVVNVPVVIVAVIDIIIVGKMSGRRLGPSLPLLGLPP